MQLHYFREGQMQLAIFVNILWNTFNSLSVSKLFKTRKEKGKMQYLFLYGTWYSSQNQMQNEICQIK